VPGLTLCEPTQYLVVEVSNPGAVGEVMVPLRTAGTGATFQVVQSSVFGVAEGSPIEVVSAHLAASVTSVRASFAGGLTDEMAPKDGWVVFADDGSAPLPMTLNALNDAGRTLATATVTDDAATASPMACAANLPPRTRVSPLLPDASR
jgi:hypothetical protein